MALVKVTTPVDEAMIRSLNVGDTVMISGRLYTGRDAVHHRIHEGTKPPVDLRGAILYHCGPVMVKEGDQWICKGRRADDFVARGAVPARGDPRLRPARGHWQ